MRYNSNGKFGIPCTDEKLGELMAAFDRLPKRLRDALNYASYKASSIEVEERLDEFRHINLKMVLDSATRVNAAAAYGPDHPQAKER